MSEQQTPGAGGAYGGQNEGGNVRDHKPVTSTVPERKEGRINPSAPNDVTATERDGAQRSPENQ